MGSAHFQVYVANINRIHLVEMIERYSLEARSRNFRASLIVNPVTGIPYPDAGESADSGSEPRTA